MNPNQGSHHQHPLHSQGNPYSSLSESKRKPSGPAGGNGMLYHSESEPPHLQVPGVHPMQSQQCGHPTPIPPGWVKSHPPHQLHQSMTVNGNCSPSSSNYGASNNYLQQQSFYPNDHSSDGSSVASPMRPGPNYSGVNNNNSSSPCPYYPETHGTDYYQHQFNNFDPSVKSRRTGEDSISGHGNFYAPGPTGPVNNTNFYSQQQYSEFPSAEYSRMVYNSGNNVNNNNNSNSGNCAAADYFTGPSSNNRPSSSCPSYGHHHVSTPLEFHHNQSHFQQPFRRNSIESFSSEPGEGRYGYSAAAPVSNSRFNPQLIKRESVIPPSWSNDHVTSQEEQDEYFFGSGVQNHQYHRPPQSLSAHSHLRCESGGGSAQRTLTPPLTNHASQTFEKSSCSFVESSDGNYSKKVIKHRSQSVSYSRNYDPQSHHHFRSEGSQYHQPHESLVPPLPNLSGNKDNVPVASEFQDTSSEGMNCGRTPSGNFQSGTVGHNTGVGVMESVLPEEGGCDEDGGDSDSASPKSSNQSDHDDEVDSMSDLEEELKKEIDSVTTTTGGGTIKSECDDVNEPELTMGSGEPTPDSPETKIEADDNDLSNGSLTLFDSIALNTFDSPGGDDVTGTSDTEPGDNQCPSIHQDLEDQDSVSGLSSISNHERNRFHHHHLRPHSNSSTCGEERPRSTSPGPQKIMKRSFSEADKELVVNTTVISAAALAYSSRIIQVPTGWTRDVANSPTNPNASYVFYTSPSDTKLRTLDEVKNYITSDGTCKCGLSCPLHLEVAFSFDPKVTNSYAEEETNVLNPNEDGKRRLCCNQKRKIPLSEDSPLISSTRDDLGDSGDGERSLSAAKKRRTELSVEENPSMVVLKEPETQNTSLIMIPKTSASSSTPVTHYNQNVPVPFAQQSPDTTTQTPQRDMSPASSVSSDTLVTLCSRSSDSTPTPLGIKMSPNSGNSNTTSSTPPGKGSEFACPTPPSTVRPQTPPSSWLATSPNSKKSKFNQHHLISKSPLKRSSSPCPNINVRQIPLEKNLPPPRQGHETSPISITPVGASHPNQSQSSPSVSLLPILNTSTAQEIPNSLSHLNTGFSISPVLPGQSGTNTLQFTSILPSTSYCHQSFGGIGMPRLVTSSAPISSTGIQPQIPSSITISMVGQDPPLPTPVTLPKLVQKLPSAEDSDRCRVKSPLELVRNVVDRFEGVNQENSSSGAGNVEQKKEETVADENQTLESKILKIIAEAASASGKGPESTNTVAIALPKPVDGNGKGIRCGVNLSMLPASSVPMSLPIISTPISIHSFPQTIFTSNAATVTTTTNSSSGNLPIMTSSSIINCGGNTLGVNTSNTGLSLNNGNQLFLQSPHDPNNPSLRYPFFQTLQPFFLNPSGGPGPLLIPNSSDPQSFIQIDQNGQPTTGAPGDLMQQATTTTMVIDPSSMSMCGNGNIIQGPGPKKKKKRLSKKQQQQQAQLQLQQQLLLQQLFNHQQVQQQHVQAAQQQLPLLLPQSFNIGPQGFLQPMNMNMNMNFFPTPTILTLPNLILNPADGTLFIQQSPQLSSTGGQATQMPPQLKITSGVPIQNSGVGHGQNVSITRTGGTTCPDGGKSGSELGVDDSSRQNATPDSSTNDCQLGIVPSSTSTPQPQPAPITVSLPLGSSTNLQGSKKGPIKSKVVSSSTTTTVHKRILPQKQILPKIDSTTPSVENN